MNPRRLAEEARAIHYGFHNRSFMECPQIECVEARIIIAQADLLEKYRHRDAFHGYVCREAQRRCGLCRAYDKLMEGE